MTAEVRKYGLVVPIAGELAEDRQAIESLMRAEIAAQLAQEGDYEIVPDSFRLDIVGRSRINGDVLLSEEEIAAGLTGDDLMARASVRCYNRADLAAPNETPGM